MTITSSLMVLFVYSQVITLTAQKMRFSIKDFFSKCDQIRRKLSYLSHLQKKSLMENFIFCAVSVIYEHHHDIHCRKKLQLHLEYMQYHRMLDLRIKNSKCEPYSLA